MISAVSYLRCSGESQIQGDTWSRQKAAIAKYAASAGLQVTREFRDEGLSGTTELEGRAGLSDCMAYCREKRIGIVLVESSDRLARDLIVSELLIREMQKAGIRVVTAGGVDLTEGTNLNPTAKLIRQILAAVAEFDKNAIVLRMKAAKDRKRAKGERVDGQKPYGEFPGEDEQIAYMREFRAKGCSFSDIARDLNLMGWRTRNECEWRASTIQKILARS